MGIAFRTDSATTTVTGAQDQQIVDLTVDWFEWICGAIEGTVTDDDGNPVEGALVKAVDTVTEEVFLGLTDADGFYAICVPPATYDLFVLCCSPDCFTDPEEDPDCGPAEDING